MITRKKKREDDAAPVESSADPAAPAPDAPAAPPAPEPARERSRSRRGADAVAEPASVNLLSPWVLDELRVVRLRKRFVAGGIALVMALGLGWTGLTLQLHQAEEEAQAAEDVNGTLSRQIAGLNDVRTYVSTVEERGRSVDAVGDAEVQFSRALVALDEALPRRAAFDTLTVTLPEKADGGEDGEAEATCPGPDPFGAVPVVACLELSGVAANRDDVSELVQELDANALFVEPFVTTTTRGELPGVSFTGSVGLTDRVLAVDPDDADDTDGTDAPEGES